jgi:glycosyltransferase involved in cell wall biosynthesis
MPIEVSVVIPTYQRPSLLKACLSAIGKQRLDMSLFEVLVITDGEDEQSFAVVEEVKQQVPNLQLSISALAVKSGPAAARNAGWRKACGRLIVFTDDDTLPHEDWLNAYHKAFKEADEAKVVFTGKVIVPIPASPTDYEMNIANLETAEFITANCACAFPALVQVRGFDEAYRMAWREDSSLHFKILSHNIPIHHVADAVVTHPVRPAVWGVSLRSEKKNMFNALLYRQFPGLYRARIGSHFPWEYLVMVLAFILGVVLLIRNSTALGMSFLAVWLLLEALFIYRRLKPASKSRSHVMEMIVTSLAIPPVSLFWNGYGAIKYRVWRT